MNVTKIIKYKFLDVTMGLLHPIPYVLHQATYIVTPFSYAPTISWFVFQNEIKKIVLQNNLCFC